MSFDIKTLNHLLKNSDVVRIVITKHHGSTPRSQGTQMWVMREGTLGTIGGGALELQAIKAAKMVLKTKKSTCLRLALGPALGQCCGGVVALYLEYFNHEIAAGIRDPYARPMVDNLRETLSIRRVLSNLRNGSDECEMQVVDDWLIETVQRPKSTLWLYGAGHVGRAIIQVLEGLEFDVTWIDTHRKRFPNDLNVDFLVSENPADVVKYAPDDAIHLVMTYSHSFDFDICHRVLLRAHGGLGVIGSKTKRMRFQSRLVNLGYSAASIAQMQCPIGDISLGKEPKAIAVGVVNSLLKHQSMQTACKRGER